ncbi:MAG TPA: hypothetical protein VEJ18_11745, partial [Planctomycetota bacterium]|nr:hypothetical protein [Planctomycetota bacterium]
MTVVLLLALLQSPSVDWESLLGSLRGPALEDPLTTEGQAFLRVKALGPDALPRLTRFISHSDILTARAAVRTLQALTGRAGALPTSENQAQIKAEWEAWVAENAARVATVEDDPHLYLVCTLDDAAAQEAIAGLSADDPSRRAEAKAALLHAGL